MDAMDAMIGDGGLLWALTAALLLGARHATEPDHLTAVSTLALAGEESRQRPWRLGLAWGLGHGATLVALGLPVVLFGAVLPGWVHRGAETLVGVLIVALAVRLLLRWRRGYFHAHAHRHGESWHVHPHFHEAAPRQDHPRQHGHRHRVPEASPLGSFGLGLVHGVGGSAGVGVLVVGAQPGVGQALAALVVFAAAAAVAMAAVTLGFGLLLGRRATLARLERLVPVLGVAGLLFGVWYAAGSLG
jgi:ABC-type nickel/cobalt efflux system permease component RcnA